MFPYISLVGQNIIFFFKLESDSFTRKKNHVKFGLILTHGFVAQLVVAYASIWEIQFNLVEAFFSFFFFHASFLQCL